MLSISKTKRDRTDRLSVEDVINKQIALKKPRKSLSLAKFQLKGQQLVICIRGHLYNETRYINLRFTYLLTYFNN